MTISFPDLNWSPGFPLSARGNTGASKGLLLDFNHTSYISKQEEHSFENCLVFFTVGNTDSSCWLDKCYYSKISCILDQVKYYAWYNLAWQALWRCEAPRCTRLIYHRNTYNWNQTPKIKLSGSQPGCQQHQLPLHRCLLKKGTRTIFCHQAYEL